VIICIIGYTVLLVPILAVLKFPQDLFMDSAEAYAWGQQFLGGYGRHPPLTGWIAGVWYRVFPAANWSSYALSHVMVGISLVSIYFIARRALDLRRAAFVVFILMLYPLFHLKSDRFNAYQVLLALMPLLVLVFLIAFEKRSAVWGSAARSGRGGGYFDHLFRLDRSVRNRPRRLATPRSRPLFHFARALLGSRSVSGRSVAPHRMAHRTGFFVATVCRSSSAPGKCRRRRTWLSV
jgi:hypothetical protein